MCYDETNCSNQSGAAKCNVSWSPNQPSQPALSRCAAAGNADNYTQEQCASFVQPQQRTFATCPGIVMSNGVLSQPVIEGDFVCADRLGQKYLGTNSQIQCGSDGQWKEYKDQYGNQQICNTTTQGYMNYGAYGSCTIL